MYANPSRTGPRTSGLAVSNKLLPMCPAVHGMAGCVWCPIVAEVGQLSRFAKPRQLMGYTGAVPSEHSSGGSVRRGAITTGNAHLRRILVEAAWAYRHRPNVGKELRHRQ